MSDDDQRDLLARIDRDILTQPNLGTVIIYEGLSDTLNGTSPTRLETEGYLPLINELQAWRITTIITTLTTTWSWPAIWATASCSATAGVCEMSSRDGPQGRPRVACSR
jgi:hypothetical protein